jgi:hypothetical protein
MDASRLIDRAPQFEAFSAGLIMTYSCSCSFFTTDLPQAVCTALLGSEPLSGICSGTYPITTLLVDDAGHLVSPTAYVSPLAWIKDYPLHV